MTETASGSITTGDQRPSLAARLREACYCADCVDQEWISATQSVGSIGTCLYCEATAAIGQLWARLEDHHQWHLNRGEVKLDNDVWVNMGAEYIESAMFEATSETLREFQPPNTSGEQTNTQEGLVP